MKPVKLLLGAAFACGIAFAGTTAANAVQYQCPTPSASFNRIYELSSALRVRVRPRQPRQSLSNTTDDVKVTAYKDTYPNPPAPTVGRLPHSSWR